MRGVACAHRERYRARTRMCVKTWNKICDKHGRGGSLLLQNEAERFEHVEDNALLHHVIRFRFAIPRVRTVDSIIEAPSVIARALQRRS